MKVFNGVGELEHSVGTHLGYSDWHTITQEQIDLFADATGDHQWIHVDVGKAARGPFGRTIAHGYLTMSLVPELASRVYRVDGLRMSVNYGSDRIRFPAPVPVGSRLRAGVELLSLRPGPSGTQAKSRVTLEIEGSEKPACVAETITVLVPS